MNEFKLQQNKNLEIWSTHIRETSMGIVQQTIGEHNISILELLSVSMEGIRNTKKTKPHK